MMTSKKNDEAFVWIWLPGEIEPVVAGKLEAENGLIHFNYGKSYLGVPELVVSCCKYT